MIGRIGSALVLGALVLSPLHAQTPAENAPVADPALPTISGPVLLVSDMARSVRFYTEGLGMTVVRSGPLTVLAAAGHAPPPIIMLQQAPTGRAAKPLQIGDGLVRFYLSSTDTDALTARLKAAGYAPYVEPKELPGVIFVRDPDGYLYEVTPPNAGRSR